MASVECSSGQCHRFSPAALGLFAVIVLAAVVTLFAFLPESGAGGEGTPPAASPPVQAQPVTPQPGTTPHPGAGGVEDESVSPIRLEPETVDLGEMPANEVTRKEFLVHNISDKPLSFTGVRASCSCVTGRIEPGPVQPGDAATLTVEYTAGGMNGAQAKVIYLMIEGRRRPVNIPVHGKVINGQPEGVFAPTPPSTPVQPLNVELSPETADMGHLKPEEARTMSLHIKNTGENPIRFTRVTTNCARAEGVIDEREIPPGDSAELKVTMTAGPHVGTLQRELKVWAAGAAAPVTVSVKANVSHAVAAEPFFLNMLAGKSGDIELVAVDDVPFRVLSVDGHTPQAADANNPAVKHTVHWDLSQVAEADLRPWFIIATDHPELPIVDLRVIHPILFANVDPKEPWTLSHDRLLIGRVAPGAGVEKEVTLVKLQSDTLQAVESPDGAFNVEIVDRKMTPKGLVCKLLIKPAGRTGEIVRGRILLKTSEPAHTAAIDVFGMMEGAR